MNGGALSGGVAMSSGGQGQMQGRATPDVQQMGMEGFSGNASGQGQMSMGSEFGMQVRLFDSSRISSADCRSAARHECVDGSANVFRSRRKRRRNTSASDYSYSWWNTWTFHQRKRYGAKRWPARRSWKCLCWARTRCADLFGVQYRPLTWVSVSSSCQACFATPTKRPNRSSE